VVEAKLGNGDGAMTHYRRDIELAPHAVDAEMGKAIINEYEAL
jgi:hypothetical protein